MGRARDGKRSRAGRGGILQVKLDSDRAAILVAFELARHMDPAAAMRE